jgi:predicted nucleotidyltransferase component of viral defense system
MIPQAFINEWYNLAPWSLEAQVEQDLILSRAIVEIFSNPFLSESLAFRGGTALHKLFIQPSGRYSEDIDLVQINEGPIGPILTALRNQLDPWLGYPKWKLKNGRATFIYRFQTDSEPVTFMRLKVEINTREHFTVLGLLQKTYEVKSGWFNKNAIVTTYLLEELLGTKLRALYQRKKGRDLFDLAAALTHFPSLEIPKLIQCFNYYMEFKDSKISRAMFEANMADKIDDPAFTQDIISLLPGNMSAEYDPLIEMERVQKYIISHLSGEAWKGETK